MTSFVVLPAEGGLTGRLRVPGDKSISHRALLLAALAAGRSTLRGLSGGEDVNATGRAVAAFGARVSPGDGFTVVEGGRERLHEPGGVVDVGNSGTGIRLLAGWAATVPGMCVLAGDASIARRPMGRVVAPLRSMGASIDGRAGGTLAPLVVRGGGLHGVTVTPEVASAQVKGALLLAGTAAEGATTVRESRPTRAHSEELLAMFGADVEVSAGEVTVRPSELAPVDLDIPADPSQAAFWAVASSVVAGSDLLLERVYLGPGRSGFLDVLSRMGARIELSNEDPAARTADLRVRSAPDGLRGTEVAAEELPGLVDEVPALAVAAALADGLTTFHGAGELRLKESDRLETTVAGLRAVGADADAGADWLSVRGGGGRPLRGGTVDAAGDHRIAMAFAVSGLAASAPVRVEGWESVATSYPGFVEDLRRCGS